MLSFKRLKILYLIYRSFLFLVSGILFVSTTNVFSAQVTLSWNPNSEDDLAGYKTYYGNSSGNYDSIIDVGNRTSYTIPGLIDGDTYFFTVIAYDFSGNESDYAAEISYPEDPEPDIKAKSSDGPITLGSSNSLLVNISLDAGSSLGVNSDWWVVAETPFGWYYFDASTMSWVFAGGSYTDLFVTYQGPLIDLSSYEILKVSGLPEGTYNLYFALDTNVNGLLDFDEMFLDSVVVNIAP